MINKFFLFIEHLSFIVTFFGIMLLITFLTTGSEFLVIHFLDTIFIFIIVNKIIYGFFNIAYQKGVQNKLTELLFGILLLLFYLAIRYILELDLPEGLKAVFEKFAIFLRAITYFIYLVINKEKILFYTKTIRLNPAQTFTFGFIFLIMLGIWLLSLPYATVKPVAFEDRVFISTSAVCVTGLATIDISTHFTLFGQSVILFLIQAGGLSIVTLYNFLLIFSGEKIEFRQRRFLLELFNQKNFQILKKLLNMIILSTLVIELIGAFLIFISISGMEMPQRIFFSIFHSISAFCNAGFSTLPDSLMTYYSYFNINVIIIGLIIAGGIGFPVLFELKENLFRRKKYSLNTRIILIMTLILILLGTFMFFVEEYHHALKDLNIFDKFLASLFQSVTTRTAGFNTIDFSNLQPTTYLWTIVLMFIGASPASIGGGLKTTTFFLNIALIYTIFKKQNQEVTLFQRKINNDIFLTAAFLFFSRAGFIFLFTMVLFYNETIDLLKILFEVVSAFSTVGLSTGITSSLSVSSKYIIVFTMFIGRIGILNMLHVFSKNKAGAENNFEYPEGYILTE